ncbi:MAG: RHS repeat-associated core domain-containing protein [Planctomycetota bacterium]
MSVALGGHARVRKAGGGAGGGGLDAGDYLYFHDTSGNVGQLVAWATGYGGAQADEWHVDRLVARYEYDPYGRIMTQSGFYAAANPFRWSTKRLDPETELSDFGRRYYSATLGRWLNRDPIGDFGGANVYAYVGNNPTNRMDYLGMMYIPCPAGPCDDWGRSENEDPPEEQEENDKKPCPKKPGHDGIRNSDPLQRHPPVHPQDIIDCVHYCNGYEGDDYYACRSGCTAGKRREPNPCRQDGVVNEACQDGYGAGWAGPRALPWPPPPSPPPPRCPGYVTRGACASCGSCIGAGIVIIVSGVAIPAAAVVGVAGGVSACVGACATCIYCTW